jgi:hypothetical protein
MGAPLKPPHDCRITARCLKATFSMSLPPGRDFAELRDQNSLIDTFFERRQGDPLGGEGGQRVSQIRTKPAFKLTSGRMRGATWFDRERPPQDIVWLLGAEQHDDRHKGKSDAYDILGRLDDDNELFPEGVDYQRLELDRRRRDSDSFVDDVHRDACAVVDGLCPGEHRATLGGVPVRVIVEELDVIAVHVAVSTESVTGPLSGLEFPLTEQRFLAIQLGMQRALEATYVPPALLGPLLDPSAFPGALGRERAFVALVERP